MNRVMCQTFVIFLLTLWLILGGCGKPTAINQTTAHYDVDEKGCLDVCRNVSGSSEFSWLGEKTFVCTWHCADYKNLQSKYISLTFEGKGCLKVVSEFYSGGLCDY